MTVRGPMEIDVRDKGLQDYRKKLLEHKEVESRLKESKLPTNNALSSMMGTSNFFALGNSLPYNSYISLISVREQLKELTKQYEKSENDLKALQSVGQVR